MKFSVAAIAIFAAVATAAPALVPAAGSEALIDPRASVESTSFNSPEARDAILQIGTGKPNSKNGKNQPILYLNLLDLIKINLRKRGVDEEPVSGNALFSRDEDAGSNNPEARAAILQIGTGKPNGKNGKNDKNQPILYLNLLDLVKLNLGKRDVADSVSGSNSPEARAAILQIGTGKPNGKNGKNGKNQPILYLNLLDLVKLNLGKRDVVEGSVQGNALFSRAEDAGSSNLEARAAAAVRAGNGKPNKKGPNQDQPIIYLNLLDLIKLSVGKRDAVEDSAAANALFARAEDQKAEA